MVSKEEFRNYVGELIKDDKAINKKHINSGIVNTLITIIAFFGMVISFFLQIFSLGIICLICFIIFNCINISNSSKNKNIENKYKEDLVKFLLKDYDYTYDKYGGIDLHEFRHSPMYEHYNRHEEEDYLKIGLTNDKENQSSCSIELSDLRTVRLERIRKEDGTHEIEEIEVFKGTFGFIKFKESFKTNLYINCDSRFYGAKTECVKLESINFNKKFYVYSDDQIEARYILNPRTMELIDKLNDKVYGKSTRLDHNLSIALIDNKMFFSFKGGFELFRLNYKYENVNEIFDNFYDDIAIILSLVDEILRNNKIFKI